MLGYTTNIRLSINIARDKNKISWFMLAKVTRRSATIGYLSGQFQVCQAFFFLNYSINLSTDRMLLSTRLSILLKIQCSIDFER